MERLKIIVAGGGIAGTFAALLLAKQGHNVVVCERRSDINSRVSEPGKTVNFTLSSRGRHCLSEVGLLDQVMKFAVQLKGRLVYFFDSNLKLKVPYGTCESDHLHSVARADLHEVLVKEALSLKAITFNFEHEILHVEPFKKTVEIKSGNSIRTESFNLLLVADGARSRTRQHLQDRGLISAEVVESSWRYTENVRVEPVSSKEINFLHVWPKSNEVVCGLPLQDGTLILNRIFQSNDKSLLIEKSNTIVSVKVKDWYVGDSVLLIGDCAHAVSPFLGQGMNLALEDALTISKMLNGHRPSVDILRQFQEQRKIVTDEIFSAAEDHYNTLAIRYRNPIYIGVLKFISLLRKFFPILGKSRYNSLTQKSYEVLREVSS